MMAEVLKTQRKSFFLHGTAEHARYVFRFVHIHIKKYIYVVLFCIITVLERRN